MEQILRNIIRQNQHLGHHMWVRSLFHQQYQWIWNHVCNPNCQTMTPCTLLHIVGPHNTKKPSNSYPKSPTMEEFYHKQVTLASSTNRRSRRPRGFHWLRPEVARFKKTQLEHTVAKMAKAPLLRRSAIVNARANLGIIGCQGINIYIYVYVESCKYTEAGSIHTIWIYLESQWFTQNGQWLFVNRGLSEYI